MGYVSFSEDIANKLHELRSIIDSGRKHKIIKGPIDTSKQTHQISTIEKKLTPSAEIETLKKTNKRLRSEITNLKSQINLKENLLRELRDKISTILEQNEISRKIEESKHRDAIKTVNSENAEVVLDIKSGIARIGSIIQQPNFYKNQDNIKNIKLIVKKLTGL